MKVAIVHDELMRRGGAEQVVLTMLKAYPDADVFTLAYDPDATYPEFKKFRIIPSKFQALAKNVKVMHTLFFPFGIWAMQSLKISGYDVVIISNTHCGKYVNVDPLSKVFIYTHTPFRLAWNPESYSQYKHAKGLKKWIFKSVVKYLKKIDASEAQKGDYFLGNSNETSARIKKAYGVNDVKIIHPDVKCKQFYISDGPKEYYLLVSRLEYYKKVDLAIQAFNKLGSKLIIVGDGTKSTALKESANDNIEFRSILSNDELARLYAGCKALIFPQYEDYGITPLEANASGRPVIAFELGGINDTMIPYITNSLKSTAVFFKEQTVDSLCDAIAKFETLEFDSNFIRKHAEKFDDDVFVKRLRAFVDEKCNVPVKEEPEEVEVPEKVLAEKSVLYGHQV